MASALASYFPEIAPDLIDVDTAPALQQRYGTLVPVLAAGDTIICHYELDRVALARHLGLAPV